MCGVSSSSVSGASLVLVLAATVTFGQTANSPSQKQDIGTAWDQLMTGAIAVAPPDPTLQQIQTLPPQSDIGDFLSHFFFETRTNYERYQTNFTGNPTYSGVINAPDTGTF